MMFGRLPSRGLGLAGITLVAALGIAPRAPLAVAQPGPAEARPARPPAPPLANPVPALPPAPSLAESPVQRFRAMLALDAGGREQALKGKTAWQQEYLREQLRLFDTLPTAEQEARLGLMQLRFYLLTLIRTAPADRPERLKSIPADDRGLVAARLEAWDRLPPDQQKELLQNEAVLSQVAGFEAGSSARREAWLQTFSPARRQEFEASVQRWRALPEEQRSRIARNFNDFFELSPRQQRQTLERVDETDRARIGQAVAAFETLPPSERARCLEALDRYAHMSPAERTRFLQNAARWQAMTSEERQTWRAVAARVAPGKLPVPRPPMPPPPMPPRSRKLDPTVTVTNAQVTK